MLDWSEVDPSILGTLFERGLDPRKRAQLGAHYTDRDKIMLIVEPVVIRPWLAEWQAEKTEIAADLDRAKAAKSPAARTKQQNDAERRLPHVPQPAEGVHRAGPGLRLGQLPLSRPPGAQRPGAPRATRGGIAWHPARFPGDRSGQRQGNRDQPLRGRVGSRLGLDRRDPVDASQRFRGIPQPDPQTARHHRVSRRDPDTGRRRAGVGRRRMS